MLHTKCCVNTGWLVLARRKLCFYRVGCTFSLVRAVTGDAKLMDRIGAAKW